jgi:hypothetical protein
MAFQFLKAFLRACWDARVPLGLFFCLIIHGNPICANSWELKNLAIDHQELDRAHTKLMARLKDLEDEMEVEKD